MLFFDSIVESPHLLEQVQSDCDPSYLFGILEVDLYLVLVCLDIYELLDVLLISMLVQVLQMALFLLNKMADIVLTVGKRGDHLGLVYCMIFAAFAILDGHLFFKDHFGRGRYMPVYIRNSSKGLLIYDFLFGV